MNESETLKKVMKMVLENAYEEPTQYNHFNVRIVPKELKSKDAHYLPNDRKIELFNLAREPAATMLSCLSCLAAHVTFMDIGEISKKQEYLERYHRLIVSALSLGIIEEADVEGLACFESLIELKGPMTWWEHEPSDSAKECVVTVTQAFKEKETLKNRGYTYHVQSQLWAKRFPNQLYALREFNVLKKEIPEERLSVVKQIHLIFSLNYYIAVPGAFEQRNWLKQAGYRWQAYGIKNAWVKKVPTRHYYQEEAQLKEVRLIFSRVTPKE